MRIRSLLVGMILCLFCCHQSGDCITVDSVINDEYNLTAKYYFYVGSVSNKLVYIVDKVGLYKVGDTLFISSLVKNRKCEEDTVIYGKIVNKENIK